MRRQSVDATYASLNPIHWVDWSFLEKLTTRVINSNLERFRRHDEGFLSFFLSFFLPVSLSITFQAPFRINENLF